MRGVRTRTRAGQVLTIYQALGLLRANTAGSRIHASLSAQTAKCLPAAQEAQVRPLRLENALQKGMATSSSLPAWRIPWTEEPGGLQFVGSRRVRHD